jgi:hypothetical protein
MKWPKRVFALTKEETARHDKVKLPPEIGVLNFPQRIILGCLIGDEAQRLEIARTFKAFLEQECSNPKFDAN